MDNRIFGIKLFLGIGSLLGLVLFVLSLNVPAAFAEDLQILKKETPIEGTKTTEDVTASEEEEPECGNYLLELVKIDSEEVEGTENPAASAIRVLDPEKTTLAIEKLSPKEQGKLKVVVKNTDGDSVKDLDLLLFKIGEDKEQKDIYDRVKADETGNALFAKTLDGGDYHVAIECGENRAAAFLLPFAAVAGIVVAVEENNDGSSTRSAPEEIIPERAPTIVPQQPSTTPKSSAPTPPQRVHSSC